MNKPTIPTHTPSELLRERKRAKRVLKGTELKEAEARSHRLRMANMGISNTNVVFNSDLASKHLSDEIIEILKDDPTVDDLVMYNHVPTEPELVKQGDHYLDQYKRKPCPTEESTRSGKRNLDTDYDDDDQLAFIEPADLVELEKARSATVQVIDRLPFWIHDLQCWKYGFNSVKWVRHNHLEQKKRHALAFTSDQLTSKGTPRKRKAETKPRRKRVPRKSRTTHTNALMA